MRTAVTVQSSDVIRKLRVQYSVRSRKFGNFCAELLSRAMH